jgi:hypothetical protein
MRVGIRLKGRHGVYTVIDRMNLVVDSGYPLETNRPAVSAKSAGARGGRTLLAVVSSKCSRKAMWLFVPIRP